MEDDPGYANIEQIQGLTFYSAERSLWGRLIYLPLHCSFWFLGGGGSYFSRRTIWGRYLFALGNNEEGTVTVIDTDRMKILAYVLCLFFAGIAGILFAFELDSVQPAQTGEFYELYAIAAAVLGGCSLRAAGYGLGVVIAAAVIRLIYNSINMVGISTHLEFGILGLVILLGVIGDEYLRKWSPENKSVSKMNLRSECPRFRLDK